MAWYSFFSRFYDRSLERLYLPHREDAFGPLDAFANAIVAPCGTGQDIPHLLRASPRATVLGIDLAPGMIARARERAAANGWANVDLRLGDITQAHDIAQDCAPFDLGLCSLGLTVVPDHVAAFDSVWRLIGPGGRMVVFDVWAEKRTFQTRQVELIARADLNRKVWAPLEEVSDDFELRFIDDASPSTFGGRLFVATGRKPK